MAVFNLPYVASVLHQERVHGHCGDGDESPYSAEPIAGYDALFCCALHQTEPQYLTDKMSSVDMYSSVAMYANVPICMGSVCHLYVTSNGYV